jgi:nucleotidyltransferase/DNA polymerase involved in DNA repair
MTTTRTIIHIDLDQFFCAVEEQRDPTLKMGTTVKLKIRWPDFTTPTRQLTLPQPTDEADVIIDAALRLFGQI